MKKILIFLVVILLLVPSAMVFADGDSCDDGNMSANSNRPYKDGWFVFRDAAKAFIRQAESIKDLHHEISMLKEEISMAAFSLMEEVEMILADTEDTVLIENIMLWVDNIKTQRMAVKQASEDIRAQWKVYHASRKAKDYTQALLDLEGIVPLQNNLLAELDALYTLITDFQAYIDSL